MSVILFLITFFVYLITLCPTVYVGDSGELIAAAYSVGIAHPPGYSLYALFGKILTVLFPIANIAYRVNLLSAVFGSLTCVVLYKLLSYIISDMQEISENLKRLSVFLFLFALRFQKHSGRSQLMLRFIPLICCL